MKRRMFAGLIGALVLGLTALTSSGATPAESAAQAAAVGPFKLRVLAVASDASTGTTFDPGTTATGVRICRFLPGASQAAVLGPAPAPPAVPALPEPVPSAVSVATTQAQLDVFDAAASAITAKYVDPLINGLDWTAITASYRARVLTGMTDPEFGKLMHLYIDALADDHSHYLTAQEVIEEQEAIEKGATFVGIGATIQTRDDGSGSVIYVLPGSPAELAGIRPHDLLLSVNGGPLRLPDGTIATRGEAGTTVTIVLTRGNGVPFSLTITRAAITAPAPVDSCLVAGTRIAYIFLPTFLDNSITAQVRAALQKLTADGPLSGVIIDNRMNGGGISTQALGVLGFFTSGNHGAYVARTGNTPFNAVAEPIGNSQSVPLVVLVGPSTVSFGEIFSGVLKRAGRAKIVGLTTNGNVELLNATDFADGSRMWLAQSTFQPVGQAPGTWEDTGIVADFPVNGLWHQFTEIDDPALAKAIEVLAP